MSQQSWHQIPATEALSAQQSSASGLSEEEVARRLAEHGPNRLTPPKKRGALGRFLLQFHNVLIYVLLGATGVTAALGHWVDSGVILGVVLINALIGFIQEGKAEKSLDAIRNMLSLSAAVVRNGRRQEIEAENLVPGDLVLLTSGDKVPADLRLVETRNLRIEEAALTGESEPVEKSPAAVAHDAPIGDRSCMAYSGTLVVFGQARGVVVASGDATEIGRIGRMLAGVENVETPLLRQMSVFGRWLTAGILLLAGLTVAFGMGVHGFGQRDVPGSGGPGGGRRARRAPRDHDHHAGDWRPAHGRAQRHHPAHAGGRNAGCGDHHLFRQDRHADPERNDRAASGDGRWFDRGQRLRLCAAGRIFHRRAGC
jgi:magnesium-transporting ATPase (P-type)